HGELAGRGGVMAKPPVARRRALTVAGVLLSVSVLAPYLVMLLTALKPDVELRITPPRLFPVSWRVTNFLDVVSDPEFRAWLRSSLVVASASTAIVLLAATPAARLALVTATIFAFIAAWNEYIVALTLMTDPDKRPLTVGITTYVTAYVQHWNHLFAASVIAIVPVVLLFALIERHLVTGLTA